MINAESMKWSQYIHKRGVCAFIKKALLKYLPLILELLELLIAPVKLFPVIRYEKEGDKTKTPEIIWKSHTCIFPYAFKKGLLAKKTSALALSIWKPFPC